MSRRYATLDYLAHHDDVTTQDVARHLGAATAVALALYHLMWLCRYGLAYQARPGSRGGRPSIWRISLSGLRLHADLQPGANSAQGWRPRDKDSWWLPDMPAHVWPEGGMWHWSAGEGHAAGSGMQEARELAMEEAARHLSASEGGA